MCLLVMKWTDISEQYFRMKSLTFIKHEDNMLLLHILLM